MGAGNEGSSTGPEEQANAEVAALRELALRLLEVPDNTAPTQLILGQVSRQIPAEIPFPEGSQILGSYETGEKDTRVIFDTQLAPSAVGEFYRAQLTSQGWYEPDIRRHGFVPGAGQRHVVQFCHSPQGPFLAVESRLTEPAVTQCQLIWRINVRHSPCAPENQRPWLGLERLMPALTPPPGARQRPSGGGGSEGYWHAAAQLEAELEPTQVGDHYAPQLQAAGWLLRTRSPETASTPLHWSTWQLEADAGEDYLGLLLVFVKRQSPRLFSLMVWLEPVQPSSGSVLD